MRRERPPSESPVTSRPQKKMRRNIVPSSSVCYDSLAHWPEIFDERQRCKFCAKYAYTFVKCLKCNMHLCLAKGKNCFKTYNSNA
ncbi:hypothetical protein QYM36_018693 [Artemia franciscana]|uniref:PiggyBac transposable element-derived protein 4 C-terminal zinc-ribbon domain-containing protein n=1 Tax=Artemia franciscana TaxID=6661 RepID=A0AA88H6F1_ARTSF|nr:hypothetical protein QYM36_018693 [Artemia franciscana]